MVQCVNFLFLFFFKKCIFCMKWGFNVSMRVNKDLTKLAKNQELMSEILNLKILAFTVHIQEKAYIL